MNKQPKSGLVVVFRGNPVDSEIIKDILEDNGIVTSIRNKLMGSIAPWQVSPGGITPVEIEVLGRDEERALELINKFHSNK